LSKLNRAVYGKEREINSSGVERAKTPSNFNGY